MRTLLLALLLATAGGSAGWWVGQELTAEQREDEARAAGKAARASIERMRSDEASAREILRLRTEARALVGIAGSGAVLGGVVLLTAFSLRPRPRRRPAPFVLTWLRSWCSRRARRAATRERKAS